MLTWRPPGDLVKVNVLANLLAARVHLQDLHTPGHVRPVHRDLPVETPWPQKSAVQHLHPPLSPSAHTLVNKLTISQSVNTDPSPAIPPCGCYRMPLRFNLRMMMMHCSTVHITPQMNTTLLPSIQSM